MEAINEHFFSELKIIYFSATFFNDFNFLFAYYLMESNFHVEWRHFFKYVIISIEMDN